MPALSLSKGGRPAVVAFAVCGVAMVACPPVALASVSDDDTSTHMVNGAITITG
jgi:hypothetical protein